MYCSPEKKDSLIKCDNGEGLVSLYRGAVLH